MFKVVDNEFNRENYSDLIGKTFEHAPPYAHVVKVEEGQPDFADAGAELFSQKKQKKFSTAR